MSHDIKTINVNNSNYNESLNGGKTSTSESSSRSSSRSSSPALSRVSSKSSRHSMQTIEALSQDPLFLVLTQFLSSDSVNMVDALLEINKTLKDINQNLLKMKVIQ